MKLGLIFPQTEIPDDAAAIRDYVQAVEADGFDYLLAFDHVLGVNVEERPEWDPLNVLRDVAARVVHGQQAVEQERTIKRAPYDYQSAFQEPLVLYAFLSGVTSSIELATGVVILPQRQTALLAKQAANVANLSNGRLRLGVGIGWNDAEYEALGMDFRTRGRRSEEQLVFLRRLWSEESVTFKGEFDRIRGAGINPRPKRPIPLWLGGNSEIAMRRAARLADGWQPSIAPSEAEEKAAVFWEHVRTAGRVPDTVGLENLIHCGETIGGPRMSPEQAAEIALVFRDAGYSHVCINTMDAGHRAMDDHLEFASAWRRMVGQ
ncbi:MAG: LLM class F420-dependent oxidoreductase [Gammaproteobacteria bacterium]|nr:LLM class F420-dependent oxidoreductase [Gammaproteobacteria bacterium]MDE0367250.1 LLM class F420-dependent oxidoreductase [Gammaproteobacteria bacterium]